jgi:hypothetical protein
MRLCYLIPAYAFATVNIVVSTTYKPSPAHMFIIWPHVWGLNLHISLGFIINPILVGHKASETAKASHSPVAYLSLWLADLR